MAWVRVNKYTDFSTNQTYWRQQMVNKYKIFLLKYQILLQIIEHIWALWTSVCSSVNEQHLLQYKPINRYLLLQWAAQHPLCPIERYKCSCHGQRNTRNPSWWCVKLINLDECNTVPYSSSNYLSGDALQQAEAKDRAVNCCVLIQSPSLPTVGHVVT